MTRIIVTVRRTMEARKVNKTRKIMKTRMNLNDERLMKTRRCIEMKRTLPSKYASAAITELTRPIEVPPTVSGRSNRGGRR
jgi:hypothetical protein